MQKDDNALYGINRVYAEHQDLLIFALTGQTGSGCTTFAKLLTSDFRHDLAMPDEPQPLDREQRSSGSLSDTAERKKSNICADFSEKNWGSFSSISVSSIIFTFLVTEEYTHEALRETLGNQIDCEDERNLVSAINEVKSLCIDYLDAIYGIDKNGQSNSLATAKSQATVHLSEVVGKLRDQLKGKYSSIFQIVGNNVRASGSAYQRKPDPTKIFELPKRIVRTIEIIREADKLTNTQTRIVIDAIRNPLELVYLRDRYAQLYAVAITTEDSMRRQRLQSLGLSKHQIDAIDNMEYAEKHDPYQSYSDLIRQDIAGCLQKSDIFINNPGHATDSHAARDSQLKDLYLQLTRYYALALRPGLVTPRRDERCMQIAFIAKANSGCISRQVGAAVADDQHVIKSIGWNDVARGQVPCALRSVDELLEPSKTPAYSFLEKTSDELRTHIDKKFEGRKALEDVGIPCQFCFKDAANESILNRATGPGKALKGNNQVHTRSLHAEENAFLQLIAGGSEIRGGYLYTTASPCELCSKKAYQLAIKEIIYIDPYPGISVSQVIMSGDEASRPKLRLFSGAVGKAYHRLYEPMVPIKDEIMLRLSAASKDKHQNHNQAQDPT